MIKRFLYDKLNWISLFCLFIILLLIIGYLDSGILFSSMAYIVFLFFIIFIIFLLFIYQKESNFYKQLKQIEDIDQLQLLTGRKHTFDELIHDKLFEHIEQFKKETEQYKSYLQGESDQVISWLHEVKTPLTTLHLMIDRLEDGRFKEQTLVEWLRIDLLLDQMLYQGRLSTIATDLHMKEVSLEDVIYDEIKRLQIWCMHKGLGIDLSLEVDKVITDEKWLSFIIRQVLSNAVKYSEKADIQLMSQHINGHVQLKIKNDGPGISQKDLPRIFERGFTTSRNRRNAASTGLGLYLVKQVTESLHVHLDVYSQIGEKTVVTLTLPKENDYLERLRGWDKTRF